MLDSVFIHFGFHKCGSTAIQNGLDALSERLIDDRIFYGRSAQGIFGSFFADSRTDFFHNFAFGRLDQTVNRSEDSAYMSSLWADIEESNCRTVAFSYEGLINLSESEVYSMAEYFFDRADRVTAVCYCRHPLSFAPSEVSQRARSGVSTAIICDDPPILEFEEYLPKFVGAFGKANMVVRDVHRQALLRQNVIADFLSLLPVDSDLVERAPVINPAITRALPLEAVRLAESYAALRDPNQPMAQFFSPKWQALLSAIEGVPLRLTDQERTFLLDRSSRHLRYLEREFDLQLLEPEEPSEDEAPFGRPFLDSMARAVKDALRE